MTVDLKFIKLSGRWFVDIPWEGSIEDLEMVAGADDFLQAMCVDDDFNIAVCLTASTEIPENSSDVQYTFYLQDVDEFGGTYKTMSYEYKGNIWLCNVTRHVLGEFPPVIYVSNVTVR